MKNENLTAEERLLLLMTELEEAEAAKMKSDKRILSLKENLSAERKNNKALDANVELIKERIKNAENAELREYLDQNGVLIKDVFAAVKDGKIARSASADVPESTESANDTSDADENAAAEEKSVTGDTDDTGVTSDTNEEEAV